MDYYTSFLLRHVDITLECMSNALREAEKAATAIDKQWWRSEYNLQRHSLCEIVGIIKADKIFPR